MSLERRTWWKIAVTAFLAVVVLFFLGFKAELTPLFIALGLAYAFNPIVDKLEKKGVSRTWATAGILFVLIGLSVILVVGVVPPVAREMQGFIGDFPRLFSTALEKVSGFARRYGIAIPADIQALTDRVRDAFQQNGGQAMSPAVDAARRVLTGVAAILVVFLNLVVVPIFFFFVLRDFHKMSAYVYELVPPRRRPYAEYMGGRFDTVISGYIRGQLVVASILAVVFSVGLLLLGVRFGLFIGILAGFLNMVPYLGQFTGLLLALLSAAVDFDGFGKLGLIVGLFAFTNFLEGHFLTPKIVGNKVGISPLWAIMALIIGGKGAGVVGMILAVPTAGIIKVVLEEMIIKYKSSDFYNHPAKVSSGSAKN